MTARGQTREEEGLSQAGGPEVLLGGYRARPGHYDELVDEDGLRPAWKLFVSQSAVFDPEVLDRAQAQATRRIRENGVTYNVYGDARPRAWSIDALPFLLEAAEWETLARGLRQRARLLEAMAADIYGDQRLLREGLLPAALVLGHPGFARCCHGAALARGPRLSQIAFDLGRGPDGVWRVIGTRAQSPSGAGYALENRVTTSRIFPDAFRDLHVQMLARFFAALKTSIRAATSGDSEDGQIVVLTPGPFNETYFEHAFLARYLGFPLVEGGDLTVRDDRVYLQTLSGLEPVAGVLRRLDDDYCDPLELRADSAIGVAGIVGAWRSGNVVMANAFGAAVLESPGLYGFLPPIAAELLGEELVTPSAATWWCGEAAALRAGSANRGTLLKPAFSGTRLEPVFLDDLGAKEREAALEKAQRQAEGFVLQEHVPLSHVPVWQGGRLESRAMMLRVFLAADGSGDYVAMPGGLVRIAGSDDRIVSGQRGGGSKDLWVLASGPVDRYSLLPQPTAAASTWSRRRGLSSRAAENLFWFGRYTERAEDRARLLRAILSRLPDVEGFPERLYPPVLRCCRRYGVVGESSDELATSFVRLESELFAAVFERGRGAGIAHDLAAAARAASSVRDHLSSDSWRLISNLSRTFEQASAVVFADILSVLDRTIVTLAAIAGLETERMVRDDAWRVAALGRNVERIHSLAGAVSEIAAADERDDPALLEWLLDLSDASITYRTLHRSAPEWPAVCDLLLFDRDNPRSAAYLLTKLAEHAGKLPEANFDTLTAPVASAIARAREEATRGAALRDPVLQGFLAQATDFAYDLADALSLRYFRHVGEITHSTIGF